MTTHRISQVEALHYPVVRVTFSDGLSDDVDLTEEIARGGLYEPLRDEAFFRTVAVAPQGRGFGWNLDLTGREIDFCSDASRVQAETRIVEELAERYARRRSAAE
jgi:hypothetical protein